MDRATRSAKALDRTIDHVKKNFGLDIAPVMNDRALSTRQKLQALRPQIYAAVERNLKLAPGALGAAETTAQANSAYAYAPQSTPVLWITEQKYQALKATSGADIATAVEQIHDTLADISTDSTPEQIAAAWTAAGIISVGVGVAIPAYAVGVAVSGGMSLSFAVPLVLANLEIPVFGLIVAGVVLLTIGITAFIVNVLIDDYAIAGLIVNSTPWNLNVKGYPVGNHHESGNGLYVKAGALTAFVNEVEDGGAQVNLPAMYVANLPDGDSPTTNIYSMGFWSSTDNQIVGFEAMVVLSSPEMAEDVVLAYYNNQDLSYKFNAAGVNAAVVLAGTVSPDVASLYSLLPIPPKQASSGVVVSGKVVAVDTRVDGTTSGDGRSTLTFISPVAATTPTGVRPVTNITPTANPASVVVGSTVHTFYTDPFGHIIDMYFDSGSQQWGYSDLHASTTANAVTAKGDPFPIVDASGNLWVFFIDTNDHIAHINLPAASVSPFSPSWIYEDLSALLPQAPAHGTVTNYGINGTIIGYKLSAIGLASPVASSSQLHLLYNDANMTLSDMYYDPSVGWRYRCISALVTPQQQGAPYYIFSNPMPVIFGGALHILYADGNGHLADISTADGVSFQQLDVSAACGENMQFTFDACPVVSGGQLNVFCNVNTQIYNAYLTSSGTWRCNTAVSPIAGNTYQVFIQGSPSGAAYTTAAGLTTAVFFEDLSGIQWSFRSTDLTTWTLVNLFTGAANPTGPWGFSPGAIAPSAGALQSNPVQGNPHAVVTSTGAAQLVYTDVNGNVSTLSSTGTGWAYQVLPSPSDVTG